MGCAYKSEQKVQVLRETLIFLTLFACKSQKRDLNLHLGNLKIQQIEVESIKCLFSHECWILSYKFNLKYMFFISLIIDITTQDT